jgi:hypothetical protein
MEVDSCFFFVAFIKGLVINSVLIYQLFINQLFTSLFCLPNFLNFNHAKIFLSLNFTPFPSIFRTILFYLTKKGNPFGFPFFIYSG